MKSSEELAKIAAPIIFSSEGNYGSVNANDNGAVSIGKIQWHGNRALSLLKDITKKLGKTKSLKYLSNTLYNEIQSSKNWSTRIVTSAEKETLEKLLNTSESKAAQDALAIEDVKTYIDYGKSTGKLSDEKALIYYADFANQYGMYSPVLAKITKNAIQKDGGTIESMFSCTKEVTTWYLTRRTSVYNKVKSLNLSGSSEKQSTMKYTMTKFIKEIEKVFGQKQTGKASLSLLAKTITISAKVNRKHPVVKPLQKYFCYIKKYNPSATEKDIDGIAGPIFTSYVNKFQKEVLGFKNPDGELTARNTSWKKILGLEK